MLSFITPFLSMVKPFIAKTVKAVSTFLVQAGKVCFEWGKKIIYGAEQIKKVWEKLSGWIEEFIDLLNEIQTEINDVKHSSSVKSKSKSKNNNQIKVVTE
jgi:hypothetical protein